MAKKSYPSREERMKDLNQRLEQGIREVFESERFRNYLTVMSRFHTYSARNVMLIHMQRPNATRVASAKRWHEQFERFINKGEKAIYIMAPIPIVKTVERQKLDPDTRAPVLDEDGQVITEKREVQVPRFRPVPVFDVSQTNGKPLPQLAQDLTGDVAQYEAFMEALRRTAPVPMEIKPMAGNLDGYFSLDEQSISIRAGRTRSCPSCVPVWRPSIRRPTSSSVRSTATSRRSARSAALSWNRKMRRKLRRISRGRTRRSSLPPPSMII